MASEDIKMVLTEVLHTLACNCKAYERCKRGNYACKELKLSGTLFCNCDNGKCFNEWTIKSSETETKDDD